MSDRGIEKLRTEIEGFDLIAEGGLPKGRATLVSGTSGSAKTVIAAQFLAAGIAKVLFFIFIVLFVIFLIVALMAGHAIL